MAEYDEYGLPVPSIRGTCDAGGDDEKPKTIRRPPKKRRARAKKTDPEKPQSNRGRPPKAPEERQKTGPKPVYNPTFCVLAKGACAHMGATDAQLGKILGVDRSTIARWKRMHSDFRDAVCAGKDEWDSNHVEGALCKRATGYEFEETTQEWDKEKKEFVTVKKVTKHIPGDVGAQRFWLTNRRKERWQEAKRIDGTMTMRLTHEEMLDQLEGVAPTSLGSDGGQIACDLSLLDVGSDYDDDSDATSGVDQED